MKTLRILGTRGVPAQHGGFETFAERLALYLVERGWRVVVYGQEQGHGKRFEDNWCGVERVRIPCGPDTPANTIVFDWRATMHAFGQRDPCLTLGYNTAVFCALLRARGIPNIINMDGIEWQRAKWSRAAKMWFWANEHLGSRLGNHLVADHPEIARHLERSVAPSKIDTIPYGADRLEGLPTDSIVARGLVPGRYGIVVARAEPENSLLEVVEGFSRRPRGIQLAVVGGYRNDYSYHRSVRAAASEEVQFLGQIYERAELQALRYHAAFYVHGHQVGGTNPSLVEALGAGNAVIAHDNRFNRWVADDAACYFRGVDAFEAELEWLLADSDRAQRLRTAALRRHAAAFRWDTILHAYEALLLRYLR